MIERDAMMMIIKGAESTTEREKFLRLPSSFRSHNGFSKTSFTPGIPMHIYRIHRPLTQSTVWRKESFFVEKGGKGKGTEKMF